MSTIPDLLDTNLDELRAGLQNGEFTSEELVKAYLARIAEVNETYNAVIGIQSDAVSIARALDAERKNMGSRSPLHGIPLLIKDNITADGLECTSGSLALLGARRRGEASVVTRLRKAGAVILGTANLSEWANFRCDGNKKSGWSPRGGQTYGAMVENSQPSGSSSGSAVATALGLAWASLGTETAGSILCPAESNNVVGYKPSRGLVANDHIIPVSSRQDVVGSLTATVKDAAYLLNGIAGRSEDDPLTWNIPFDPLPDFTKACSSTDLTGVRIGVPRNAFTISKAPVREAFDEALRILTSAGATIVENANFPGSAKFEKMTKVEKTFAITAEFKEGIEKYLGSLEVNPHNLRTIDDLIQFTKTTSDECYPEQGVERFLWTQAEGVNTSSTKYKDALELDLYFAGEGGIEGALDKNKLDLLVVASAGNTPDSFAAKGGFPTTAVPLGFFPSGTEVEMHRKGSMIEMAPGIPFCIVFLSRAYADSTVLRVAYAFEQLSQVRKKGPKPWKVPGTNLKDIIGQNNANI